MTANTGFSQKLEGYKIKYAQNDLKKNCGEYLTLYKSLPPDVRLSIDVKGDDIYFYFPSLAYFHRLFDKNTDGIAVDIVSKDQYACEKKNKSNHSWAYIGELQTPVYKDEIVEGLLKNDQGYVYYHYGKIPAHFDLNNIECNLLVLQKNFLCRYHSFSNLDFHNWSILETGLYLDSITGIDKGSKYKEVSKTLNFTIPFKKNQVDFDDKAIKPLYDSLELTDYDITEIWIKAYSSVEGSLEKNKKLQEGRAQSIVDALQVYQKPEIISHVSAHENWVGFMNSIEGTPYEYLKRESKVEVKRLLLKDKKLLNALELSLNSHRKGLVKLTLHKKYSTEENDPVVLRNFFEQSLEEKNIQEALYLQEVIFDKIREHTLPEDFIGQLEVPQNSFFGPLINNFGVFRSQQQDGHLYANISDFEKILEILPNNAKVKYNILVLKMKAWQEGELYTNRDEIGAAIKELKASVIDQSLILRLKINYAIILTEYLSREGDYKNKEKAIRQVYALYKNTKLSDRDRLSMAKYLSYYSQFNWAQDVLRPRIDAIDVEEDLVFYYLKLTISDDKMIRTTNYRTLLLNAIDKNNQRFCDLFLPTSQGGFTFQLLTNIFLKRNYCENCP